MRETDKQPLSNQRASGRTAPRLAERGSIPALSQHQITGKEEDMSLWIFLIHCSLISIPSFLYIHLFHICLYICICYPRRDLSSRTVEDIPFLGLGDPLC